MEIFLRPDYFYSPISGIRRLQRGSRSAAHRTSFIRHHQDSVELEGPWSAVPHHTQDLLQKPARGAQEEQNYRGGEHGRGMVLRWVQNMITPCPKLLNELARKIASCFKYQNYVLIWYYYHKMHEKETIANCLKKELRT